MLNSEPPTHSVRPEASTGGAADLTFFDSTRGQGQGGGGARGLQRAGLAPHEARRHLPDLLSPGRGPLPDARLALQPETEPLPPLRSRGSDHLGHPPLQARRETGTGRAGPGRGGVEGGTRLRAGPGLGAGAGPGQCSDPAVQPFLSPTVRERQLLPDLLETASLSISRRATNACRFTTYQELSLTEIGLIHFFSLNTHLLKAYCVQHLLNTYYCTQQ